MTRVPLLLSVAVLTAVVLMMLVELQLSRSNERRLRASGAVEPPDDPYRLMRLAYPLAFVSMAVEGALQTSVSGERVLWGLAAFGLAKAIKFWAIASLGTRWSFRVLVLPNAPLVTTGPYKWMRHPNYVGVVGELIGIAITLSAILTGVLAVAGFGWILMKRIRVEDRVLGRSGLD